jgi:hypothetical protein
MKPRAFFSLLAVAVLCAGAVFLPQTDTTLTLEAKSDTGHALDIVRRPAMPFPYDQTWNIGTWIQHNGAYYSSAWMVISGRHEDNPDVSGHYRIKHPCDENFMLGVWSDVDGPSVVLRGNNLPGSYPLCVIDDATGKESARISNDGVLACKSVETKDGVNGVYRIGPAVVTLKGGRVMKVEGVKAQ